MAMDLHPLDTGELIDRTFSLYRKHFLIFTGIVAIPQLVAFLIRLGVIGALSAGSVVGSLLMSLLALVVNLIVYAVSQGATVAAVSDVYLDRPTSIGKAYADSKGKLLNILFASIFISVATGFGFILLIVPGVIWMTAWSLAIPSVVMENMTPIDAMKRSWALTKDGRGRILLAMILVGILIFIISLVCQVPGMAMAGLAGMVNMGAASVVSQIVLQIGTFIANCVTVPLLAIAMSLIYYDQRVRKEGFDLQVMLSSLEK
ncbi:MAG: glycerophosphoryl diester phosphodiesterase membrane domain-containing protein [Acidobacteriota bacterium]|jgi:membrane-anchored glycerophosphoryl diester phosphodiesterase (GDPDase)|nr:glycerophosphoryl diester phosphodiesterase membrane domain-containing protein [Acidobacteriota bacterium]